MTRDLVVDVGVPVQDAIEGDDGIIADVLPAGQYATLTHVGHPSELLAATEALLDWAAGQGLTFDMTPSGDAEQWVSRLEIYLTDPSQEPDMNKWVTQLAFRLT
jgi:effector-binding domain-containing protein